MAENERAGLFLAKAEEALAGAESEFANSRYNNCANRSYYACFLAAIAALVREGIEPRAQWGHEFVQSQFVGQLLDGNGFALAEVGLHGLVFRADGFGDPNTLYFTSRFNNEDDGLFGGMTTGLVSMIRVSAPDPTARKA